MKYKEEEIHYDGAPIIICKVGPIPIIKAGFMEEDSAANWMKSNLGF